MALPSLLRCIHHNSPFSETNPHATEELYYKRAVDRFEVDGASSFIVSVPFDAGTRNDSLVTATRAIYVRKYVAEYGDIKYAPVQNQINNKK